MQTPLLAEAVGNPEVIVETNKGTFTLELYQDKTPNTVANFLSYVDEGFYDNTLFHRVEADFVIQGGGFERGMKEKKTHAAIKNESDSRLKNITGSLAMARKAPRNSATSQFFINLSYNSQLDYKSEAQPGYTVFGRVSQGLNVVQDIGNVATTTHGDYKHVPIEDVVILSIKRKAETAPAAGKDRAKKAEPTPGAGKDKAKPVAHVPDTQGQAQQHEPEEFVAGEHYTVLERPVPTRDRNKIEVVETFSYGCPHCYEFESSIREWSRQQGRDVDFWGFPAVWNEPMKLYARAFYAAHKLNVWEIIHQPLFTAVVIENRRLSNESELAEFFFGYGVDKKAFSEAFNSPEVATKVQHAEERTRLYRTAGTPEVIINGKYRVDHMRAGGLAQMLAVTDFLIDKERAASKQQ